MPAHFIPVAKGVGIYKGLWSTTANAGIVPSGMPFKPDRILPIAALVAFKDKKALLCSETHSLKWFSLFTVCFVFLMVEDVTQDVATSKGFL